MARMARVMAAGVPFHVTHRGNQKRSVFSSDAQRREYLRFLRVRSERFGMRVWAYCLMPNHVHLLVVGERLESIAKAVGQAHRAYARRRHEEVEVTGHLWANRFFSTALDETHLWAAVRYVELNPVRAGIASSATDYAWSSAAAHAFGRDDALLDPGRPFPGPIGDWERWLGIGLDGETTKRLRRNTSTGRPMGGEDFVREIERQLGRSFRPGRRGPKPAGSAHPG